MHSHDSILPEFEDAVRQQVLAEGRHLYEPGQNIDPKIFLRSARPATPSPEELFKIVSTTLSLKFFEPSLRLKTPRELGQFWLAHADEFRAVSETFAYAAAESGLTAATREELIQLARGFGGERAETALRCTWVDLAFGSRTIRDFPGTPPTDDDEDSRLAYGHNVAHAACRGVMQLLFYAAERESPVSDEQRFFIPNVMLKLSGMMARVVQCGAELRGIQPTLDGADLRVGWNAPCAAGFEYILHRTPSGLQQFLNDETLSQGVRARAAEALAVARDPELAVRFLSPLLNGPSLLLRESCINALEAHVAHDRVREMLSQFASDQKQPEFLRELAQEALGA